MTDENKRTSDNVLHIRVSLVKIKSAATVALKHLESVENETLPEDPDFLHILWTLLGVVVIEADDIDRERGRMRLPGID